MAVEQLVLRNPVAVGGREDGDHFATPDDHRCSCGATIARRLGRGRQRQRCDACRTQAIKESRRRDKRNRSEKSKKKRKTQRKDVRDAQEPNNVNMRPIPGWPSYMAGEDGHVYSTKGWRGVPLRRLAQGINIDGYQTVQLSLGAGAGGRTRTVRVHALIASSFLPPKPENAHDLRHIDGNSDNNAPSNLCWGTQLQNARDRDLHGRTARGERNPASRLTREQVGEMRRRALVGETQASLARSFSVHASTVSAILSGRLWSTEAT